jgi:hypothetical protein
MPASYAVRQIPNDQYTALKKKAAQNVLDGKPEISINKLCLKAIEKYLKSDVKNR